MPPGDIWSDQAELAKISQQAEQIIFGDFQRSRAAIGAIDIFFDPGNTRVDDLIAFISRNSFGKAIDQARMKAGFIKEEYAVPDILSSRGALGKSEHYEIKPNSRQGRTEGKGQIARFAKLNKDFDLLFFPGEEYDPLPPDASQIVSVVDMGILEITLTMHWFREGPGLLLYEFCSKERKKEGPEERDHENCAFGIARVPVRTNGEVGHGRAGAGSGRVRKGLCQIPRNHVLTRASAEVASTPEVM
jgi:hypothetical protein